MKDEEILSPFARLLKETFSPVPHTDEECARKGMEIFDSICKCGDDKHTITLLILSILRLTGLEFQNVEKVGDLILEKIQKQGEK